jgi:hypothetical protein
LSLKMCIPWSHWCKSWDLKDREPEVLMPKGRRSMCQLQICFLFYSNPQSIGWCPTSLRVDNPYFIHTHSNALLAISVCLNQGKVTPKVDCAETLQKKALESGAIIYVTRSR